MVLYFLLVLLQDLLFANGLQLSYKDDQQRAPMQHQT